MHIAFILKCKAIHYFWVFAIILVALYSGSTNSMDWMSGEVYPEVDSEILPHCFYPQRLLPSDHLYGLPVGW